MGTQMPFAGSWRGRAFDFTPRRNHFVRVSDAVRRLPDDVSGALPAADLMPFQPATRMRDQLMVI